MVGRYKKGSPERFPKWLRSKTPQELQPLLTEPDIGPNSQHVYAARVIPVYEKEWMRRRWGRRRRTPQGAHQRLTEHRK